MKITKTQFNKDYNIIEIETELVEIMNIIKKYKDDKKYAVAIAKQKPQHPDNTEPSWFKEFTKLMIEKWERQEEFNKKQLLFNQMVIEQFNKHGW